MSHAVIIVALSGSLRREELEAAVKDEMAPFDENDEGCFQDGTRWDWWIIGGRWPDWFGPGLTVMRKGEFQLEAWRAYRLAARTRYFQEEMAREHRLPTVWSGIEADDTLETFLGRDNSDFPTGRFLRSRHWHEPARLGWFGLNTKTECELAGEELLQLGLGITLPEARRCATAGANGGRIVVWNEEWQEWNRHFRRRFIDTLPDDTWLVSVDYHV